MRKLALLFIVGASLFYFYPADQDSSLARIKTDVLEWFESIGKTRADFEAELQLKNLELEIQRRMRAELEKRFRKREGNAPFSEGTGKKIIQKRMDDLRPQLDEKIRKLKEEIATLESRIEE